MRRRLALTLDLRAVASTLIGRVIRAPPAGVVLAPPPRADRVRQAAAVASICAPNTVVRSG